MAAIEDVSRRLTLHDGKLKLASPAEGALREAAEKGGLKGVSRAVKVCCVLAPTCSLPQALIILSPQIGGVHVMLSVHPPAADGSVLITAFDVRASSKVSCIVPSARVPSLPPSLIKAVNPLSPPLPDAWETLATRLSIATHTKPATLIYS